MATLTVTGNASTSASLPVGKPVRMVTQVVDFSSFTNAAGDVVQVIEVPANTLCLYAGLDVLTADGAGNSGTLSLGDGADVDRYVAASTATAGMEVTEREQVTAKWELHLSVMVYTLLLTLSI